MKTPLRRTFLFFIMLAVVVLLPWWISVPLLVAMTIYFPLYLEVLFFSFLFDTLYSVRFSFPYTFLTSAFIFLLIVLFARNQIRT